MAISFVFWTMCTFVRHKQHFEKKDTASVFKSALQMGVKDFAAKLVRLLDVYNRLCPLHSCCPTNASGLIFSIWTLQVAGVSLGLDNIFCPLVSGPISKRYGSFASVKRLRAVISVAAYSNDQRYLILPAGQQNFTLQQPFRTLHWENVDNGTSTRSVVEFQSWINSTIFN